MVKVFPYLALLLAAATVFVLDRSGRFGPVDGLLYFVLGLVPLSLWGLAFPLGLPTALMLLVSRVSDKKHKLAFALVGALVGCVFFSFFRPGGT